MKKNDKKTDNTIVKVLTQVCEDLKYAVDGFQWITHFVDYGRFPQSLTVVCVFESNAHLNAIKGSEQAALITQNIVAMLSSEGITPKGNKAWVVFDAEENGADVDSGAWCSRYQ